MPIKDVDWEVGMEGWVGNKSQKRDRKKRKEDLRQVRNAKGKIQGAGISPLASSYWPRA